ncbi:MAG: glycoside hydrolase family 3 C-terminal domain-containing protein [Gemmatimonadota bacterium]
MALTVLALVMAMAASCARKPAGPPYRDTALPIDVRARDLLSRMTLKDKVSQTRYDAPAIPRLGIPAYNWWSEALHGVARAGKATVFPQAIALAATFDDSLMYTVATAISDEARAKHAAFVRRGRRDIYQGLTFFSPNINIFRDPRWGRGQETYGEDPVLTSRMGVAFVRGMQGDDPRWLKTLATAKHYAVHDGPEPERHSMSMDPSEQDLWSTYLPAFQATAHAGAASVMCAYSAFRGTPDCASDVLLDSILRGRMGFGGYVVSDCWALNDFYKQHHFTDTQVKAAALALKAGTDLNCGDSYPKLVDAVNQGLATEAEVDTAVLRLLRARLRLGLFADSGVVPWDTLPYDVVASPAHRALALRAARESIVLLKNDGVLPLKKSLGTVAVVGPDARAYDVLVAEYNGTPERWSYPVEAIRDALAASGGRVVYAVGSELADGVKRLVRIPADRLEPSRASEASNDRETGGVEASRASAHSNDGETGGRGDGGISGGSRDPGGRRPSGGPQETGTRFGLRGEYFGNNDFSGAPAFTRVDSVIDFTWLDDTPVTGLLADSFAVRWTGRVTAPVSGVYRIGFTAMNAAKVWFQDSLRLDYADRHVPQKRTFDVRLEAGRSYPIRIDYLNYGPNPEAHLVWAVPDRDLEGEALRAAREADAVVLVLGLSPSLVGEENGVELPGFNHGDRTTLGLPAPQQALLKKVAALGKPTVLVLMSGSALAVPWAAEHVDAIVQAWYPGEAGGEAIADVLFGDVSPAGRLPVTVYRSVKDLPPFQDYGMDGHTYRYFKGTPLYPFGYGLSYTTFAYSNLRVPEQLTGGPGDSVVVDVTNAGKRAGEEVVQLYVSHPDAPFRVPIRALKDFRRIHLEPGETRTVSFPLDSAALSVVGRDGKTVVLPGSVLISVGGQQPLQSVRAATTGVVTRTVRIVPYGLARVVR